MMGYAPAFYGVLEHSFLLFAFFLAFPRKRFSNAFPAQSIVIRAARPNFVVHLIHYNYFINNELGEFYS